MKTAFRYKMIGLQKNKQKLKQVLDEGEKKEHPLLLLREEQISFYSLLKKAQTGFLPMEVAADNSLSCSKNLFSDS